jgi:nucleoside-diphosphate-sugar epimerase
MNVLVIGGTLFIGRALVRALLKDGHTVTVLHRKASNDLGRKVANLTADRNDPESIRTALAGARFDVVFDNVYDWKRGTTADQVLATARACGDLLSRYVFMSSVAAYGDGLNHQESDALAPDDHPDSYVRNKATTERALFRFRQRTGFPAVTLRPPFVYGPENPFYREAYFWDRLRRGRPIILPGDGRRLMQFVYVKDLVAACLSVMREPKVEGHAFNVGEPHAITQTDLVLALARATGAEARLVHVPRSRIRRLGGHPLRQPLYFGVYYDVPPITMNTAKAQRMLKFKATDFAAGLKQTHRWYLENHVPPKFDFSFEDSLIAGAGGVVAGAAQVKRDSR